jgi:hypothetical protein
MARQKSLKCPVCGTQTPPGTSFCPNCGNRMPTREYDPSISAWNPFDVGQISNSVQIGDWFIFLRASWLHKSGLYELLAISGITNLNPKSVILYRGQANEIKVPGARITPKALPRPQFISLTCDKALYRANRDTVRLLIAAPQSKNKEFKLKLRLSGNPYADYPLTLDEYGLCLWSMSGLPEGEYEATLDGTGADVCRFEVAEYRLAPLNAELVEQQLSGETLEYTLSVTAFGQPYSGPLEVELQERGQRIGKRERLTCDRDGQCRGTVKLTGAGPYTLSVFAGERTATVALKGSEQERRETLKISELGEVHELSLLPLPDSDECRGMYVMSSGSNTEPFLVRNVIGSEVEITARLNVDMLRTVVVDPARGTSEEALHEHIKANDTIRLPVPAPYGIVLLGALVDAGIERVGTSNYQTWKAWEGWCAVLHPSDLQLQCEAPKEAKPGARITVTLKTGVSDREIPVQLIVKDQRLIAPSDPQVELAACIKKNLSTWSEQSETGDVNQNLSIVPPPPPYYPSQPMYMATAMPVSAPPILYGAAPPTSQAPTSTARPRMRAPASGTPTAAWSAPAPVSAPQVSAMPQSAIATREQTQSAPKPSPVEALTKVRVQFPEIIYNNIVKVQGEEKVKIKLGDSMTRYSIEAFALSAETLDWQRAETTIEAVQPVYGELTVSPFVFPGDPVMGRLDVGAASGKAIVEVQHDGETLPLFLTNGSAVPPGVSIPSGSVVRFPLRPGAITATVRDARTGEADVSERYVTEPGKLRHIMRRLRLLTPGDEVTLREAQVLEIKPMPGLERPFQFFVEGAAKYPFG